MFVFAKRTEFCAISLSPRLTILRDGICDPLANYERKELNSAFSATLEGVGKNIMNALFCERLKELRKEKKLGQVALAEKIGVGKSVISAWELGKCEPSLSNLIAIAKFFDVSTDYLAGLED